MHFKFIKKTGSPEWRLWQRLLRDDPELHPHVVVTVADDERLHLWRTGTLGRLMRICVVGDADGRAETFALALPAMRQTVLKAPVGEVAAYLLSGDEIMRRGGRAKATANIPCPVTPVATPTLPPIVATAPINKETRDAVSFAMRGRLQQSEYEPRDRRGSSFDAVHFFRDRIAAGTDRHGAYVQDISAESWTALAPVLRAMQDVKSGGAAAVPAALLAGFSDAAQLDVRANGIGAAWVSLTTIQPNAYGYPMGASVETAPVVRRSPPIPQALPDYGGLDVARLCSDREYFEANHRVRVGVDDMCVVQVSACALGRAVEKAEIVQHVVGDQPAVPAVILARHGDEPFLSVGGQLVPYGQPPRAWPARRRVLVDPDRLRAAALALHDPGGRDWPVTISHQGAYAPLMLEVGPMHVRGVERERRRVAVMPLREDK